MAEEDYDIVPHKEVLELKKQVEEMKQHPFGTSHEGKDMLDAIKKLSDSMDRLTGLFEEAAEQMKLEEREAEMISKRIEPLFGQMNDLVEQNRKIAKGIIAVADMVKESNQMASSRPQGQPMRQQSPYQQNYNTNYPPRKMEGSQTVSQPPLTPQFMQPKPGIMIEPSPISETDMFRMNPPGQGQQPGPMQMSQPGPMPPPPFKVSDKKGFMSFMKK